MYEPSCRKYIYPIAYRRVNKKRPEVPEDVLIYKKMMDIGNSLGMSSKVNFHFSTDARSPVATIYYFILSKIKILANFLPVTCNYIFQKVD